MIMPDAIQTPAKKRILPTPVSDRLMSEMQNFISESSPGRRLPSENSLIAKYGISCKTVRRVFGQLEEEGTIIRRRGSGSYVAAQPVFTFMLPCPGYLSWERASFTRLMMKGAIAAATERHIAFQTVVASLTNDYNRLDLSCISRMNRFSKVFVTTWFYNLFEALAQKECQVALYHFQDIPRGCRQYLRNWILMENDRTSLVHERMDDFHRRGCRRIALVSSFILSEKNHSYCLAYREKAAEFGQPELMLEVPSDGAPDPGVLRDFWLKNRYDALIFSIAPPCFFHSVNEWFGIPESIPAAAIDITPSKLSFERCPDCWDTDPEKVGYDAVAMLADYERFSGTTRIYPLEKVESKSQEK